MSDKLVPQELPPLLATVDIYRMESGRFLVGSRKGAPTSFLLHGDTVPEALRRAADAWQFAEDYRAEQAGKETDR